MHAKVAAILATLSPRTHRETVVTGMIATEIAYDWLDELTEQPEAATVATGLRLHRALTDCVSRRPIGGYFDDCPQLDDAGYLEALVATGRACFDSLPSAAVVRPVAAVVAAETGEAQTRAHAIAADGVDQLREWAEAHPSSPLHWWELAAGYAASIITLHGVTVAATGTITDRQAASTADAYLPVCAAITMLDSLLDRDIDAAAGAHNFARYYGSEQATVDGIAAIIRYASTSSAAIHESGIHHRLLLAGAIGFYMSDPAVTSALRRRLLRQLPDELRTWARAITMIFRMTRGAM